MSRPTDLTPELADKLCDLVRGGLPLSKAAEHEGISYRTLCRWQKREDGAYAGFCHSLKRARAEAQVLWVGAIARGEDGWQSRAWLLERSDPKNWGRRMEMKAKVETKDTTPEQYVKMTREQKIAAHAAAIEEERKAMESEKAGMH